MDNVIIFVDDRKYCFWEHDLQEETLRFLRSLDGDFFSFQLETYLNAEDEHRAAMAIRLAYHHALETLFSLLGAMLQAPKAPQAWLARCTSGDLRHVIERISKGDASLQGGLTPVEMSWKNLAAVTMHTFHPGTEHQQKTIELFGQLWSRLASEYLDEARNDEHNSLKHGFRVGAGGFGLVLTPTPKEGEPEQPGHVFEKSEFGCSFKKILPATQKRRERSLVSKRVSINWKIEKVSPLLQLAGMSVRNVIGAMRVLNGDAASDIRFDRPANDEDFLAPFKYVPSVSNFQLRVGDPDEVPSLTEEEINEALTGPGEGS